MTTVPHTLKFKKFHPERAEIPSVHPAWNYPKCAENFSKVLHYHDIFETPFNKRRLYLQMMAPLNVDFKDDAWFKKQDIDCFDDELPGIEVEEDPNSEVMEMMKCDSGDDYQLDDFTDSDEESIDDNDDSACYTSLRSSKFQASYDSLQSFFQRNLYAPNFSNSALPGNISLESMDIFRDTIEPQMQEMKNFDFFKRMAEENIKGIFVFVHGYADHSTRNLAPIAYERLCNQEGMLLVTYDQYGHGLSEGPRGLLPSIESLSEDLLDIIAHVKNEFPNYPIIVSGTSLGGLVSLIAHILKPNDNVSDGIILTSPLIELIPFKNEMLRTCASIIGSLGLGNLRLVRPVVNNYRNKKILEEFQNDPFVYQDNVPISTGDAIFKGMKLLRERASILILEKYKILAQFGTADTITDPSGASFLENNLTTGNLTIIKYQGSEHMIYQEPFFEEIAREDYMEWMRETFVKLIPDEDE